MKTTKSHYEWENKGLTVSIPTKEAQESLKTISSQVDDDFLGALLGSANGVSFTIRGIGAGNINSPYGIPASPSIEKITLNFDEARELANWILEHIS